LIADRATGGQGRSGWKEELTSEKLETVVSHAEEAGRVSYSSLSVSRRSPNSDRNRSISGDKVVVGTGSSVLYSSESI
jgi:hypothetical protein